MSVEYAGNGKPYHAVMLVDTLGVPINPATGAAVGVGESEGTVPAYATGPVVIPAGLYSFSALNSGSANATINGLPLPPGISISWVAAPNTRLKAISIDATGTTLRTSQVV